MVMYYKCVLDISLMSLSIMSSLSNYYERYRAVHLLSSSFLILLCLVQAVTFRSVDETLL